MNEEWRPLPGYEGVYAVSSLGRVRSSARLVQVGVVTRHLREKALCQMVGSYGHFVVTLTKGDTRTIARVADLMLLAFVGPAPEGQEAVHLDGDTDNNLLNNLAYGASRDGENYVNNGNAKLVDKMVSAIRHSTEKNSVLANRYQVSDQTIRNIKAGKTWRHVA